MIKNPFCMPRLRPSTAAGKSSGRLSPVSLLDRLREAVFRLIMLSALSKGSNEGLRPSAQPSDQYYYPSDPHHSEAVADCIEFINKSATTSDSAVAQVVIPLPVM